jgi:hypothetical protein
MPSLRLNIDYCAWPYLDRITIQLHLPISFQNQVDLGGFLVIVPHRVSNEGDMAVADGSIGPCERSSTLATDTLDGGGFI